MSKIGVAVVGFVGTLVAARLLGASGLGFFYQFYAVLTVLSLFTEFGLGSAATKRISEGIEEGEFFSTLNIASLTLFVFLCISLLLVKNPLISYLGSKASFYLLFPGLFLSTFSMNISSALRGEKKVGMASSLELVQNFTRVGFWILLILLGYGFVGLIFGYLAGMLVSIILGFFLISIRPSKPSMSHFKSIFDFSKYSWIGSIRGRAWSWTDVIVLGFFVSPNFVGVYEACWKISGLFFFVSLAIQSALFPNISELDVRGKIGEIRSLVEESLRYLGLLSIPGLFGSLIIGKDVLRIYGNEFTIGFYVLILLILARLIHGYEAGFSSVFGGLNRPELMFKVNLIFLVFNLAGNYFLIKTIGWIGAAIATALSVFIAFLISLKYLKNLLKFKFPLKDIFKQFISALIMLISIYIFKNYLYPINSIETILLVILGTIIYFFILLSVSKNIRNKLLSLASEIVDNIISSVL